MQTKIAGAAVYVVGERYGVLSVSRPTKDCPMKSLPPYAPTVFAIDDHRDELLLIRSCCESIGLPIKTFQCPLTFLRQIKATQGCVVADLLMPQMTGLQLHAQLRQQGVDMPIIVVTGHADAGTCRTAFNSGVFDFVEKGFNPHDLMEVIQRALQKNEADFAERHRRDEFLQRLSVLSPREKDVMYKLAEGKTLKEIATGFAISVQTASKHRGNLFGKLAITNEVELLKLLITVDPNHGAYPSTPAA